MVNKRNIRKALKAIEKLSLEMDRGMGMDFAMDGSGECGSIIAKGWRDWFNRKMGNILADNGVSLQQVQETADAWANRELEMGPKKTFVTMHNSRRNPQGFWKEVDIFDTRWGNLSFAIHSSLNH